MNGVSNNDADGEESGEPDLYLSMPVYYHIPMLPAKMNREQVVIAKKDELDVSDAEYWSRATIEEKLQTITYLRECFYGEEATSGRLHRIHTMLKLK